MASLTILQEFGIGEKFQLEHEQTLVGRHPDCQIQLDVGAISRQHAKIIRDGDNYFVEDLGSRNGTYVNGDAVADRLQLAEGDQVQVCDMALRFSLDLPGADNALSVASAASASAASFGEDSSRAILVDEPENSKVMSKLELANSGSRLMLEVNPMAKLHAVLEISRDLSRSLALDEVLPKVIESLFKIFVQADRGFVVMRSPDGQDPIPRAIRFRHPEQNDTIRISRTIMNRVMDSREAILSADAASDERFDSSQSIANFHIRSMMCVPLLDSEGTPLGVIQIDTINQRNRFTEDDLAVLAGVAAPAGIAIENAQLHEDILQQQSIELDLEMAHRVQQGLLPAKPPEMEGYSFFDFYESAKHVGGDSFDYISLPNGRLAVLLADVSGKGVAAALLMAQFSSEARFCLASEDDPAKAISRLNATLNGNGWEDRFVTALLIVLDPATHEATLVNAGHMSPLFRHNDGIETLGEEHTGLPLGVVSDYEYESFCLNLNGGDYLALYTDGFSEAMNSAGDLYGIDRLEQRFSDDEPDAAELGRHLLEDVKQFVAGHPQSDDMCLVCIGKTALVGN